MKTKLSKWLCAALLLAPLAGQAKHEFEILRTLDGATEGSELNPLIVGTDGRFYGTAASGGAHNGGTVFAIDKQGALSVLHSFGDGDEGSGPDGPLLWGRDSYFYGNTYSGGADSCGALYRMSPASGEITTLHALVREADGCEPVGALVQGPDGAIYGTAISGGAHTVGTVWRWSPNGKFKTLWHFTGELDGQTPAAGLTFSKDGRLFGTATLGGERGQGTVFSLNTDGSGFRTVHSFGLDDDTGHAPRGELLLAKDGNFYGTAIYAPWPAEGTVYRLSPDGTASLVAAFDGRLVGGHPRGRLAEGPDGTLFGTLFDDGPKWGGGVFSVTAAGQVTLLRSFDDRDPLSFPLGGLVRNDGYLYGTGRGAVYRQHKP